MCFAPLPRTGDFYQHPMGVVVIADSEEICDRALRLLKIEWEELPFILDMEDSLKPDAPKIMPEVKRLNPSAKEPNTVLTAREKFGDVEKGFAESDKIVEYIITRPRNTPAGVEPIVCVAQWRGEFLDLWVHHQEIPQGVLTSPNTVREKPLPPVADWTRITVGQGPLFPNLKPEDLDIRDSMVFEKANPKNRRTVREVSDAFWATDPPISHPPAGTLYGLTSDGKPDSQLYAMARQAHFIEVEVDTETGMVYVTNIVCVNDVGHLFNPEGAYGQQYGGAVMGLGRSGTEEHIFCPRTGVALNLDLIGYHMRTMNDYPPAQCLLNESHLGYAAYGAYGIGENVGASVSGITVSAIHNATGKWVMDYPTTPDRVLKALGKI